MIRYLTAGESHGPGLTGIIEGLPAGVYIDVAKIDAELRRRQRVPGRGGRMSIEADQVKVLSGLRGGYTLGSPLALYIENKDYANWESVMHPTEASTGAVVTTPRPGHADYPGAIKYGFTDIRNVIERASARETAMRTAQGAVARQLLSRFGVEIYSRVRCLGPLTLADEPQELEKWREAANEPYGCGDKERQQAADALIAECRQNGHSVGGIVEIVAFNLPVGWGSYVHADRRLDGRIAGDLVSIPGIKGIEFGTAFAMARQSPGSCGDVLAWDREQGIFYQGSSNAGLAGGVTTGQPLVVRCAVKATPTLTPSRTVDILTKEVAQPVAERSDTTLVPAVAVVGEAVLAMTLLVAAHSAPDRY
ncbi:MAG: chorismate synthase [Firmicutes bacterium]|nr:chorismate synthase [Dethiobacter sp.]MBS3889813.1 chorismate synthase [Bacillota bacterium]